MPCATWRGSDSQGVRNFQIPRRVSSLMSAVVPGHSSVEQHVAVTPANIVA